VQEFVSEFSLIAKVEPKTFPSETLDLLQQYEWPGNVRELKNLIERLMIMTQSDVITTKDIPAPFNQKARSTRSGIETVFTSDSLKEAKGEFEKAFIEEKLNEYNGNISQTAEAIGIERSNLHKKIKQYNLGR
jgi:two-component system nitrogen regulation response regulator NtrX